MLARVEGEKAFAGLKQFGAGADAALSGAHDVVDLLLRGYGKAGECKRSGCSELNPQWISSS